MIAVPATVFSEWLTDAIYSRRWGPSDLARHTGVSATAVQKWLSGESRPYPKTCYAIAEALGIPVQEVLDLAGYKTKPVVIPPDLSVGRLHTTTITPATPESLETRSDAVKRAMAAVAQAMKALEEAQSALDATQTPDD